MGFKIEDGGTSTITTTSGGSKAAAPAKEDEKSKGSVFTTDEQEMKDIKKQAGDLRAEQAGRKRFAAEAALFEKEDMQEMKDIKKAAADNPFAKVPTELFTVDKSNSELDCLWDISEQYLKIHHETPQEYSKDEIVKIRSQIDQIMEENNIPAEQRSNVPDGKRLFLKAVS